MKYIIRKGTPIWRSRATDIKQDSHWDTLTTLRDACYFESDLVSDGEKITNPTYLEFWLPENIDGWKRICVKSIEVEGKNE